MGRSESDRKATSIQTLPDTCVPWVGRVIATSGAPRARPGKIAVVRKLSRDTAKSVR